MRLSERVKRLFAYTRPALSAHQEAPRAGLADFGLARPLGQETRLARMGESIGTPAYMSPEQESGEASEMDERCEIYSHDAVLYHMLVGQPTFEAESRAQLLFKVVGENARSPRLLNREVPAPVEAICMKAIEKEPSHRYQHARELVEEVNRFLDGEPTLARTKGRLAKALRWLRRHRWKVLVAAAVSASFFALGGYLALRFLR